MLQSWLALVQLAGLQGSQSVFTEPLAGLVAPGRGGSGGAGQWPRSLAPGARPGHRARPGQSQATPPGHRPAATCSWPPVASFHDEFTMFSRTVKFSPKTNGFSKCIPQ